MLPPNLLDLDDDDEDGTAGGASIPATRVRPALKKKTGSTNSEKGFAAAIRNLAKRKSHVETKKTVGG